MCKAHATVSENESVGCIIRQSRRLETTQWLAYQLAEELREGPKEGLQKLGDFWDFYIDRDCAGRAQDGNQALS